MPFAVACSLLQISMPTTSGCSEVSQWNCTKLHDMPVLVLYATRGDCSTAACISLQFCVCCITLKDCRCCNACYRQAACHESFTQVTYCSLVNLALFCSKGIRGVLRVWHTIVGAISVHEPYKVPFRMCRLSPIVPWNMLNYALSVTGVGFWQYAVSSAVAVLPWNVTFAYFGSLAHTMADVIDGNTGPGTRTSIIFLGISGVMLAAAVTYTTIIAK